jgi:isochorismate pyruvate lyase
MSRAIDRVKHCTSMQEVRREVNALDDVLVPLLVERVGYMSQAARIKQDVSQVRDEARIQAIVAAGRGEMPTPWRTFTAP